MQSAKRKERHFGVCRGELKQTRIKECNEKYNTHECYLSKWMKND
jgi:hypothetical protein